MTQYRLYIAGEDVAAASGATFDAVNPTTGETWATHSLGGAEDVDRAVRAAASAFEAETWRDARVPVVSNVTAEPKTDAGRIRALLAEQVRSPVEWVASVERLAREGVDAAVELGPGTALVGMVRRIAPDMRAVAVGEPAGVEAALETLGAQPAGAGA